MTRITDTNTLALLACEEGFDPIEDRLRANIRGTIEAVFNEELNGFLGGLRHGRAAGAVKGLSYDFPRLLCDKGAAARHPKYAGQRRGTDREWVGRFGPCGSVIAPVFSHDLNG